MADPYAKRFDDLAGRAPGGEPAWLHAVRIRLGGERGFVVVADAGSIAPVARAGAGSVEAMRLTGAKVVGATATGGTTLMLKHGWVAGPPGEPGCVEVTSELLRPVLDAIIDPKRRVIWERDPDFGYEVPARVEGLDEAACRVLCPRLHYADHDRVYEHAELVAETKRRWFEQLSKLEYVPADALAAIGWPPQPTGDEWRER